MCEHCIYLCDRPRLSVGMLTSECTVDVDVAVVCLTERRVSWFGFVSASALWRKAKFLILIIKKGEVSKCRY